MSARAVIRYGLAEMLKTRPDRFVVAVLTGRESQALLRLSHVVIYDLAGMADQSEEGLAGLLDIGRPVLVFELFNRPDVAERALVMGAADAVPVDVDVDCLLEAVERVAAGHVLRPGEHQAAIQSQLRTRYGLTGREATVLGLVAAGLSNREIARVEYLSINSVKTYIRTGYRKIGVRSRSEAMLWAARHNLTALDPRSGNPHHPVAGRS